VSGEGEGSGDGLSPVSIQTQSLALRALHYRKPQETQRKRQPIRMLGRSSGNHDWLLAKRKRLRFLRFSFTQRTRRKRLRLNGNRALERPSRILFSYLVM